MKVLTKKGTLTDLQPSGAKNLAKMAKMSIIRIRWKSVQIILYSSNTCVCGVYLYLPSIVDSKKTHSQDVCRTRVG